MATTTTITTSYDGEMSIPYISAALLEANSIAQNGIMVKSNIKYKEKFRVFATDGLVSDSTCDFTDTSTITTVEREIAPKEFQVNLQFCRKTFRNDWDAMSMGVGAFDNIPKNFSDYLLGYVAAKVSATIESNIWHGVDGAGTFDGLVNLMTADATVTDVVGVSIGAGGITAANVTTELGKVVDAIDNNLYNNPNLRLYVSQNVYRAYVRALGGFGAAGLGAAGVNSQGNNQAFGDLMFDGVKIFVANGLNANYIVAGLTDNFMFGCGLLNDNQQAKVLDMADLDGSENVRVIMRYTAAVQYGIGSELVLYTPV